MFFLEGVIMVRMSISMFFVLMMVFLVSVDLKESVFKVLVAFVSMEMFFFWFNSLSKVLIVLELIIFGMLSGKVNMSRVKSVVVLDLVVVFLEESSWMMMFILLLSSVVR